jgi:hypothetical protein
MSNFLDGQTTVLHERCLHFVNDISISARWWSPRMLVTVRRHAAIFNVVEPLFNLSDPHCIIVKSQYRCSRRSLILSKTRLR